MPAVTFTEAARALGFRSRSTLFRLKEAGELADYLRPPSSPGGAQLLELEPRGLPPLREAVARLIRPQVNNCERYRQPRSDPRWGAVAGVLSEALADHGALSLCAAEAEAIAAALPDALAEAFGAQGLELLRVALADRGCWLAGPGTPLHPEAEPEWWNEWGRWEPGPPLEDGPFWESVGGITGGMMGPPFHGMSGGTAAALHHQMRDAIDEVGRGARWDPARWDAASARSLLDDSEVINGECLSSRPELERLAAGGLLPPDLQAAADAALERYQQPQEARAPLALPCRA
jgi:hypothetical protein